MMNYNKLIKITFWYISFPIVVFEAIYLSYEHLNLLNSNLFLFSILLWVPMIILKSFELENKTYDHLLNEFRNMTLLELIEKNNEIMSLPPFRNSALIKEAYREIFAEKNGKNNYY